MNTNHVPNDNKVDHYEIRLKGHLTDRWISRFGDVFITLEENGITLLTFPVVDQAALFGLISRVRDLGLTLISVKRLDEEGEGKPQTGKGDASDKIQDHPPTDKD